MSQSQIGFRLVLNQVLVLVPTFVTLPCYVRVRAHQVLLLLHGICEELTLSKVVLLSVTSFSVLCCFWGWQASFAQWRLVNFYACFVLITRSAHIFFGSGVVLFERVDLWHWTISQEGRRIRSTDILLDLPLSLRVMTMSFDVFLPIHNNIVILDRLNKFILRSKPRSITCLQAFNGA